MMCYDVNLHVYLLYVKMDLINAMIYSTHENSSSVIILHYCLENFPLIQTHREKKTESVHEGKKRTGKLLSWPNNYPTYELRFFLSFIFR